MALRQLSSIRGDTKTLTLTFKNAAGVPYNIKNWAVHFTLKQNASLPDSEAILQKIVTSFADSTSGTSGVAVITLNPSDTVNIDPGTYDFDIAVTTNENKVYTVMRGKYDLEYDVTRTAGTAGTAV
jgi:hypothetical protein